MGAFEFLHPQLQRWLYEHRWESLRPVQSEAIETYVGGPQDFIVSAPTAGGKTEAAFLPVLSAMVDQPLGSVRALYVGPLRALINDQFRRCEDLCQAAGIPVHRWHGDVGQAERKRLVEEPGGVLLITPESIESLLINRSSVVRGLFADLRDIVIDELHVFPGCERGLHLRSLLHRVDLLRGQRVRRIGLSATLGDPQLVAAWLHPQEPASVRIITDAAGAREIRTRIHAYVDDRPDPDAEEIDDGAPEPSPADAAQILTTASGMPTTQRLVVDIYRHHPSGVNLIFANRKRDLESIALNLRALLASERLPNDPVLVHHGSLSRDLRTEAEQALQAGGHRICLCSSTLELGIDIGDVRAVGHIDAPWTVASLAQRLGRSGRRAGETPTLRQYILVQDPADAVAADDAPGKSLELDLVRAAATVSLHLERWCEPTDTSIRDLTVRFQQILSVIAQFGGVRPDRLYAIVSDPSGVGPMPVPAFKRLLTCMKHHGILEQISNGELLVGKEGELLVNGREFYAVFMGGDGYRVFHGHHAIGELPATAIVAVDDGFVLAGRAWHVVGVDMARRTIEVLPGRGRSPVTFTGGTQPLHPRVVARMREILAGRHDVAALLDPAAARALTQAREAYAHLHLDVAQVTGTRSATAWTWLGGTANRALVDLLKATGTPAYALPVGVGFDPPDGDPAGALQRAGTCSDDNLRSALAAVALPLPGKYDHLVPVDDLVTQYLERDIDLTAARRWLEQIAAADWNAASHGG